MRSVAALLVLIVLATPASGQVRDPEACQALAASDPGTAVEAAREWSRFGGDVPAGVCEALALEAMGALGTAGRRLEELARSAPEADLADADRAALLEIAAGFHLRSGMPGAALAAAEAGLALPGASPLLNRLKGQALTELGEPQQALVALNAALAERPDDVTGLKLRARLRREAEAAQGALADAAEAVRLAPEDPGSWFEKGAAEAALGRNAEARESLLTAISLDREGLVGNAARVELQRMETD